MNNINPMSRKNLLRLSKFNIIVCLRTLEYNFALALSGIDPT
jgi:hypothetical protein